MRFVLGLMLLVAYQLSFAGIYKWTDENGRVHFGDKPNTGSSVVNQKITGTPKKAKLSQQLLHNKNSDWIRLLEIKSFIRLSFKLKKLQRIINKDISKDTALVKAYLTFKSKNLSHGELLNQWVNNSPKSYPSYLARAFYYYQQGWTARGNNYRSKTSDEAFANMDIEFSKALADLRIVDKLVPHSLAAYYLRIRIFSTTISSKEKEFEENKKKSIQHYPASYEIRHALLQNLNPKWGGSLEKTVEFIKSTEKFIKQNSRLTKLRATVPLILANKLLQNKEYELAIKFYDLAIGFNKEDDTLLNRRATSKYLLFKYEGAFKDISGAIKINNSNADYYKLRAKIALKLDNLRQANEDKYFANRLEPSKKKQFNELFDDVKRRVLKRNKIITKRKTQTVVVNTQIITLNQLILKNPKNSALFYKRARAYLKINKVEKALSDAKNTIALAPKNLKYYKLIDDVLVYKRDWPSIIYYWKRYLKYKPNNAEAHYELFGTYHHKKDEAMSRHHLSLAAKYGHGIAKKIYDNIYAK